MRGLAEAAARGLHGILTPAGVQARRGLMGAVVRELATRRQVPVRGRGGALPTAWREAIRAGIDADAARDPATALGVVYQVILGAGRGRKVRGAYYTPPAVVDDVLARTLDPAIERAMTSGGRAQALKLRVCDPACGSGNFLAAAARRIAARSGAPLTRVVASCVYGADLDPLAVELAAAALRLEGAGRLDSRAVHVRCGDSLLIRWERLFRGVDSFDAVVGNPPFLSRLATETASPPAAAAKLNARFGDAAGVYTDPAALFLLLATELARDGGRIGLVLPQSVLAARDATVVRRRVLERAGIESIWIAGERVFDASVVVCAPTLRIGAERGRVTRTTGLRFRPLASAPHPAVGSTWASLALDGVPVGRLKTKGSLGDIADATADFRDQYYGLRGCVIEDAPAFARAPRSFPRLVTTGLIDPGRCAWGSRPTRFDKQVWDAPRVDVSRLSEPLQKWAAARLVPKVLLATQTKVLEAVVDERGEWLPAVPIITVVPRRAADLWRVAAVLNSPVAAAWALRRYAGAGLSAGAIKLSARQAMDIPLPAGLKEWKAAGAELAMGSAGTDDEPLVTAAKLMMEAYGLSGQRAAEYLGWWRTGVRGRNRVAIPAAAR